MLLWHIKRPNPTHLIIIIEQGGMLCDTGKVTGKKFMI